MMIHPSNRWEENKREVEGDDGRRKMFRRTKEGGRGKDKNEGGKEQRVGGREGKKQLIRERRSKGE